jgi:diguanylate cyclase (GGDEF)-like protein/PAS domain S-box-containing protein
MSDKLTRNDDKNDRWRHALDRARLGVWDWDLVTGECLYSASWKRMLGYEPHELPDDDPDLWLSLAHPDDRERAIESGDRHIAGDTCELETQFRMRHKDGRWLWIIDRGGVVEWDVDGKPTRMIGVQTDISRQKATEHDLKQLNERFRLALDASDIGIWQFEPETGRVFWDARMRDIHGIGAGPSEVPRETWQRRLHPDDGARAKAANDRGMETGALVRIKYRIVRPDGEVRHLDSLAKFVRDAAFSDRLVGTIRDITEEVAAADALATEKEKLRVTLQSITDAVVSTDTAGRITFANDAALRLLASSESRLAGQPIHKAFRVTADRFASTAAANLVITLFGTDEVERVVRCAASPIVSPSGTPAGMVHIFQDVTEEQARQRELAFAARHDSLTGVYNRAAFEDALRTGIQTADTAPFVLLYIDLDHFKALNDFAGHAAGDAALKAVTRGIRDALPHNAVVGRLGGDEFAVIVPATDPGEAADLADSVLTAVRTTEMPHNARHQQLAASVGVEIVSAPGGSPTDTLARADDACYAAKASGRNRVVINNEGTGSTTGLTAVRLVSDINEAMEDGRLTLFGQEIRRLDDPWSRSRRVEVLARLTNRNGDMIPPAEFIRAAERFGVAGVLDRWIFESALETYGGSMRTSDGFCLGFNLSAQTLSDPQLWDFASRTIAENEVSPSNIVFEITETAAVTNFEAAERFVRAARAAGCRVSLDDFGAGLSSFGYLRRFPIDSVKIDGVFVENVAQNRFDKAIVASIAGIARDIGFDVVAERIEDPASIPVLKSLNVKFVQGYLLHRPEPLARIIGRDWDAAAPGLSTAARQAG